MTDGPKRTTSEPTLVIPRESLRPVSKIHGPTIEQLATVERARRDLAETLVPCPTCEHCASCKGMHMVSPAHAAEIKQEGDGHA